jgi:hypothetical protein
MRIGSERLLGRGINWCDKGFKLGLSPSKKNLGAPLTPMDFRE